MKRINLKDFYPFYEEDCYVDVPDELAALMQGYERQERAYTEKTRYHKAYYSLERDPSLEKSVRYHRINGGTAVCNLTPLEWCMTFSEKTYARVHCA